jgi:hypothetical protein
MGRRVRSCTVRGPLARWAAAFESWLAARGYSPWTVRYRVCMLADLSRWLAREGLGAKDLTAQRAELFVGERRAGGIRRGSRRHARRCRLRICGRSERCRGRQR